MTDPRDGLDRTDVTVTIVSWNTRDLLVECLHSLKGGARQSSVEVQVVDNGSTDGSVEAVQESFPHVRLIRNDSNLGFSRAVNQSWPHARGRYWLLLNSDAETADGAIDELVEFMDRHPRTGLASAHVVGPDGRTQPCAQAVPGVGLTLLEASRLHKLLPVPVRSRLLLGSYFGYNQAQRVGWTWGTALLCRREAVDHVGLLSEQFFLYGEDLDWSLRMNAAGWEVWFCPTAQVVHHDGGSAPAHMSAEDRHEMKLRAIYAALGCHRGRIRMTAIHAATIAAAAGDWVAASARRRPSAASAAENTVRFHVRAIEDLFGSAAKGD